MVISVIILRHSALHKAISFPPSQQYDADGLQQNHQVQEEAHIFNISRDHTGVFLPGPGGKMWPWETSPGPTGDTGLYDGAEAKVWDAFEPHGIIVPGGSVVRWPGRH